MIHRIQGQGFVSLTGFARSVCTTAFGLAFPLALASCEPTQDAKAPSSAASSGKRNHVLSCYAQEYGKKKAGEKPKIDDSERKAADDLLAKYGGDTRRACGAVNIALSGPLCNLPVALASVVACERAHGKANLGPSIDSAAKQDIQQRMDERRDEHQNPGAFSY